LRQEFRWHAFSTRDQAATLNSAVVLASASRNSAAPQHEQTHGEQKDSVFSVETNLVTLDVTVTDKRGRPLDRLKKEDFRVFEAGVQQNIAFFSHENRPASWGIVLDRSGSMAGMMDEVYNATLHSVEAGTHDDDIFVITFNGSVDIIQDFTSDRRRLLESTRNIIAGGSTALYDAVALAISADATRRRFWSW
jgi:VWFA-related protein